MAVRLRYASRLLGELGLTMSQSKREATDEKQYWKTVERNIYHLDRDCRQLAGARSEIEEARGPLAYNERECMYCGSEPKARVDKIKAMDPSDFP